MGDYNRALQAFGVVHEAGGRMVPELANRSGHRNYASGRHTYGWGGVGARNLLVVEIGCWRYQEALEIKSQRTSELIRSIESQEDDGAPGGENSSEEEDDDDADNISV